MNNTAATNDQQAPAIDALTLLRSTRNRVNSVTNPTGFVILTDAIQYLLNPGAYTRHGFGDWRIVSLPDTCSLCGEAHEDHRPATDLSGAFCMAPASRFGDRFVKGGR